MEGLLGQLGTMNVRKSKASTSLAAPNARKILVAIDFGLSPFQPNRLDLDLLIYVHSWRQGQLIQPSPGFKLELSVIKQPHPLAIKELKSLTCAAECAVRKSTATDMHCG